jgi:4-amino-4-deoxy-L-arabinose transferase-like glycosyltransferase
VRHFIVTEQQAGKLPRWALLLLCALYVFPGLVGREPWRTSDGPGFATALTMVRGSWQDWLIPNIAGELVRDEGPFAYALLALANKLAASVSGGVTLSTPWPYWIAMFCAACGLMLMLMAFWYAAYELAARPGLLPLDPFGAAASRVSFARAIADTALLVLIATLGLLVRMHEISSVAAQVTWVAVFLWSMSIGLERPRLGALVAAFACTAIFATRNPVLALGLVLAPLILCVWAPAYRLIRQRFLPGFLVSAITGFSIWPLLVLYTLPHDAAIHGFLGGTQQQFLEHWMALNLQEFGGPSEFGLLYLGRTFAWYYWPAWPLAAYAIWQWREKLSEPSLALPVIVLGVMILLILINPHPTEAHLAAAAPVVALLAAPSLTTLRRSLVNMIDWFAVMCFSFLGFALWFYWFALITGQPEKVAFRAAQFAPNFALGPVWIEILLGGLASASWILLVRWRISRQPPMIWRAVVLSASGLTLVWFLMMTLWLPVLNERMGFRTTAASLGEAYRLANKRSEKNCVNTLNLELAPRASFFYFANLPFAKDHQRCDFLLEQRESNQTIASEHGKLLWKGFVPAYRIDEFRLYRRNR